MEGNSNTPYYNRKYLAIFYITIKFNATFENTFEMFRCNQWSSVYGLSLSIIKSFEFSEVLFFLLFFIVAWKATTIFRQSSLRALDRVPWFTEGSGPLSPHFLGLFGFLLPLSQNLSVFSSGLTVLLSALALNSQTLTFPLQHDWCYKALDLKNNNQWNQY